TYDQSESDYYRKIDSVMSPWIDYDSIAKGVMGRKYYTMATEEQRQKFLETFKDSLVETYGKSLLGVENPNFELEGPESGNGAGSSAQIRQTLFSGTGRVVVIYAMGQADDGRWQVKNVILEGINLGRTFRNQFARSAQEYN
ncbi:MAG: ABC transporter substrate-binding protein, partial [Pseudomonadales bacterium]